MYKHFKHENISKVQLYDYICKIQKIQYTSDEIRFLVDFAVVLCKQSLRNSVASSHRLLSSRCTCQTNTIWHVWEESIRFTLQSPSASFQTQTHTGKHSTQSLHFFICAQTRKNCIYWNRPQKPSHKNIMILHLPLRLTLCFYVWHPQWCMCKNNSNYKQEKYKVCTLIYLGVQVGGAETLL